METNLIRQKIHEEYEEFSPVERRIADYLLQFEGKELPSAKELAARLYVSEAALTRFSKRCGFHGFRELGFSFINQQNSLTGPKTGLMEDRVMNTYQYLLDQTLSSSNEEAIRRTVRRIMSADKILVCGIGNSGIAAMEYRLRLLRIGLNVEIANEGQLARIMASLLNKNSLMIALSVSGATKDINNAIKLAHAHGAETILVTSSRKPESAAWCTEILQIGTIRGLDAGTIISPQLPLLLVFDLIYSHLVQENYTQTMSAHQTTATALGIKTPSSSVKKENL